MEPKRLTMLRLGYCDACGNIAEDGIGSIFSIKPFLGWQCCDEISCVDKILQWKMIYSINQEDLVKQFGSQFLVKRSSGDYETNWEFDGNAFFQNGTMFILLVNRALNLKKNVQLKHMIEWNSQKNILEKC